MWEPVGAAKAAALWAARTPPKELRAAKGPRGDAPGHKGSATRQSLYGRAKARNIEGRSKMSKRQLENALH